MPTAGITTLLEAATNRYAGAVSAAFPYLAARGIDPAAAEAARLGVVSDPEPGHEDMANRLSIPYLTRAGVVNIKFRCLKQHDCKESGCAKYLCLPGLEGKPRLYNVNAFFVKSDVIAITEGELDALILSTYARLPAVGCPGVSTWQAHFPRCFHGYGLIVVFADGDKAGREWARMIQKQVPLTRVIHMPDGMDVNDAFLLEGADGLRQRAGLDA